MAGHPLWPDDVEKKVNAVLNDVQAKLTALQPAVESAPVLIAQMRSLLTDMQAEVAALKAVRERVFHP